MAVSKNSRSRRVDSRRADSLPRTYPRRSRRKLAEPVRKLPNVARPNAGGLAIHVSRSALIDITRAMDLAVATATVCISALNAQNADLDADVALALRWSVVDVVSRQSARLRVIADAQGRRVGSSSPASTP